MKNIVNTQLSESRVGLLQSNKKRLLSWSPTAIAFLLTACGRETRSTTEVPLTDDTSNTPTAFNDKLVGSDDLDTFTGLAGDDEIYGFGGNDQIIAERVTMLFMVGMEMTIFSRALAMIKSMAKVATIRSIYLLVQILKMVVTV